MTVFVRSVLLVALAVACSSPDRLPPLPEDLDSLDPAVAEMLRDAHTAIEAEPGDATLWFDLGMGYQANELFDRAESCYERAVELDDEHAKAWYQLGQVRKRNGDLDGAIEAVERAGEEADYAPAHWRAGEWYPRE